MIDITNSSLRPEEKTAVALGYFDGFTWDTSALYAPRWLEGLKPAVFTFNCDTTLPKFRGPEDIISFENKCELMQKIGVKYIYAPDFAEVCALSDEDFVKKILIDRLNAASPAAEAISGSERAAAALRRGSGRSARSMECASRW